MRLKFEAGPVSHVWPYDWLPIVPVPCVCWGRSRGAWAFGVGLVWFCLRLSVTIFGGRR